MLSLFLSLTSPYSLGLICFTFICLFVHRIHACGYMLMYTRHVSHLEFREQLLGPGSLLPPYR